MKKIFNLYKPTGKRELFLALFAWINFLAVDFLIILILYIWFHGTFAGAAAAGGGYHVWLPTLLQDLSVNYPGAALLVRCIVLLLMLLLFALSLFLSGGIYSSLGDKAQFSPLNFIKRSSRIFGSMVRLTIAFIPIWLILAALPGIFFKLHYTSQEGSPSESLFILFAVLWVPCAVFFWIVGKSAFDYARVHLVNQESGVTASLKKGLRSLWERKLITLVLFITYLLYFSGILMLSRLPGSDMPLPVILIIHQVSVLLRYYGKVLLMKGEVTLLQKVE